jgi:hypothetical protein
MKEIRRFLLILLGIVISLVAFTQDFKAITQKEMKKMSFMTGEWQGEGWVMTPEGMETSRVKETISYDLDNTVLRLRGVGTADKDGVEVKVHDALGVLYFDPFRQQFGMSSWISKGMHTDANVELLGEGRLKWWFEAGPAGTIRYTLKIENNVWVEIGEMSQDGETWKQFFEMKLEKK